jgi:hypothetical protein
MRVGYLFVPPPLEETLFNVGKGSIRVARELSDDCREDERHGSESLGSCEPTSTRNELMGETTRLSSVFQERRSWSRRIHRYSTHRWSRRSTDLESSSNRRRRVCGATSEHSRPLRRVWHQSCRCEADPLQPAKHCLRVQRAKSFHESYLRKQCRQTGQGSRRQNRVRQSRPERDPNASGLDATSTGTQPEAGWY